MINVQLGKLLLVYAHLLLRLYIADLALHLVPRQVVQVALTIGTTNSIRVYPNWCNPLFTSWTFSAVL